MFQKGPLHFSMFFIPFVMKNIAAAAMPESIHLNEHNHNTFFSKPTIMFTE
jgi:hypothetical protein